MTFKIGKVYTDLVYPEHGDYLVLYKKRKYHRWSGKQVTMIVYIPFNTNLCYDDFEMFISDFDLNQECVTLLGDFNEEIKKTTGKKI